jgi:hypothetical protein
VGGGIACLLSVKGNRSFRTTVARDGLERDEEYEAVARKSLELVLNHVVAEIDRISALPGAPLSQASSAARWLTSAVKRSVGDDHLRSRRDTPAGYLSELLLRLPTIVVEDRGGDGASGKGIRRLLSKKDVLDMSHFWTIDSRAFDYLGTISRDLGREIEIHKFIKSVGVDFEEMLSTPLVVDAPMHESWILAEFEADAVSMGLARQYTKIRWKQDTRSERVSWENYDVELYRSIKKFFEEVSGEISPLRLTSDGLGEYLEAVKVGTFDESLTRAAAIRTSWVTVINGDKEIGKVWSVLDGALKRAFIERDTDASVILSSGMLCVSLYCFPGAETYNRSPPRPSLASWWERSQEKILRALAGLKQEALAPVSLEELRPGSDEFVDTKRYWRDWLGGGE